MKVLTLYDAMYLFSPVLYSTHVYSTYIHSGWYRGRRLRAKLRQRVSKGLFCLRPRTKNPSYTYIHIYISLIYIEIPHISLKNIGGQGLC